MVDQLKTARVQLQEGVHPFHLRTGTTDEMLAKQIFGQRLLDLARLKRGAEIQATYERIVAAGKTPLIVDAGAYIGASAVFFHACFPKARIFALEPEASNFEMLCRNAAGIAAIEPCQWALAGAPGRVRVIDPKLGYGHLAFRVERAGDEPGTVRATTVAELVRPLRPGAELFIVKVDTEGSEKEVFQALAPGQRGADGIEDWLDETPVLIVEVHDWLYGRNGMGQAVIDALAGRDRDFIVHGENLVSLSNSLVRA